MYVNGPAESKRRATARCERRRPRGTGSEWATIASLSLRRPDPADEKPVHEAEHRDEQDEAPGDRGCVAELELRRAEELLVQVQDDRLVLPGRPTRAAAGTRLEEVRLRDKLQPAPS